jgi:hypothetical protein
MLLVCNFEGWDGASDPVPSQRTRYFHCLAHASAHVHVARVDAWAFTEESIT